MSKKVKCCYCNNLFDRESEEYIKVGNRYSHLECFNKHKEESDAFKKLTDLIKRLYKGNEPDWNMIGTQIKRYRDEGMTYYGMYYTLIYFFEIKKNNVIKDKGIGIIPYTYKKAQSYYKNINNVYTQTAKIESSDKINIEQTENIVIIENKSPEKKLMDFKY